MTIQKQSTYYGRKKCSVCQKKFTKLEKRGEHFVLSGIHIRITCGRKSSSKYEEKFSHKSCQEKLKTINRVK